MSLNTIGYIIFFIIIYVVTIHIGLVFYRNGEHFLKMLLPNDLHLVNPINHVLLVGYYLLNLGYSTISIIRWPEINSTQELIAYLSGHAGFIIFMLALIHYFNMTWLFLYSRFVEKQNKIHTNNNLNQ